MHSGGCDIQVRQFSQVFCLNCLFLCTKTNHVKTNSFPIFLVVMFAIISCTKPRPESEPQSPAVPGLAGVITQNEANLSSFSVVLSGAVTDSGRSAITEVGIVADTSTAPTEQRNFKQFKMEANGEGQFSSIITNLPAEVTFYVRAYAKNSAGIAYGNEIQFTTKKQKILQYSQPILRSQQEVETFGANQYTEIVNGLHIQGTDITDLSPLSSITVLGGGLTISGTSLVSLRGLDQLEIIGNRFYNSSTISNNRQLKNLDGLSRLMIIRGSVNIHQNDALHDLSGLDQLTQIEGGDLHISNCANLERINGFKKLWALDGSLTLNANPKLQDLSSFRKLSLLTGNLTIIQCNLLQNIEGFEGLTNLNSLHLNFNDALVRLDGFKNVTKAGAILLDSMASITDLTGLSNISSLDALYIKRVPLIKNLSGLSSLAFLGGLRLEFNAGLLDLKGLEKITQTSHIQISFNPSLRNLTGLNALTTLTGTSYSLTVSSNPSLSSLTGLENLRNASGQLFFEFNAPDMDYCPLKPFLSGYTGNKFIMEKNGLTVTRQDVLQACPQAAGEKYRRTGH